MAAGAGGAPTPAKKWIHQLYQDKAEETMHCHCGELGRGCGGHDYGDKCNLRGVRGGGNRGNRPDVQCAGIYMDRPDLRGFLHGHARKEGVQWKKSVLEGEQLAASAQNLVMH